MGTSLHSRLRLYLTEHTRIDFEHIKKFWLLGLIAQSGSLKSAAKSAHISPSAVSQALKSLEKHVGKPLIIRNRDMARPTPEAIAILATIDPAFNAFSKLNELGSHPVPKLTWLEFGTYESLAVDILPGLIRNLKTKLPRLRLGLTIGRSDSLTTMIHKGELCSALITETDDMDRFYSVAVGKDRLGLYTSARNPILFRGPAALKNIEYGSLSPGKHGLPRYFQKFVTRLNCRKPSVTSESFEALRAVAVDGMVAAVLPHRVASRRQDLVEITPAGETKTSGEHGIFVISQRNCDEEEANFIAGEIKRLM